MYAFSDFYMDANCDLWMCFGFTFLFLKRFLQFISVKFSTVLCSFVLQIHILTISFVYDQAVIWVSYVCTPILANFKQVHICMALLLSLLLAYVHFSCRQCSKKRSMRINSKCLDKKCVIPPSLYNLLD